MPAQRPPQDEDGYGSQGYGSQGYGAQDDLLDIIPQRLVGEGDEPEQAAARSDDPGRSRSLLIGGLLVGVAVAGAAGFYIFPRESGTSGTVTPPVITAESGPYKVRPADPGGMQVPNQDKLVFERSANGKAAEVENLLPEPQVPTAPPTLPQEPRPLAAGDMSPPPPPPLEEGEAVAAATTPALPATIPGAPPAAVPVPSMAAPLAVAPAPQAEVPPVAPAPQQPSVAAAPVPVPAAPATPAPAPKAEAPAKPAATGSYMIQFAALRDDASARKLWDDLKGKHPDLLGSLSPVIQKADLGPKGVFYRVRATGLPSDAAARALCDELAKRKVGCLFVGQ